MRKLVALLIALISVGTAAAQERITSPEKAFGSFTAAFGGFRIARQNGLPREIDHLKSICVNRNFGGF